MKIGLENRVTNRFGIMGEVLRFLSGFFGLSRRILWINFLSGQGFSKLISSFTWILILSDLDVFGEFGVFLENFRECFFD
jgi:hypothetical protein